MLRFSAKKAALSGEERQCIREKAVRERENMQRVRARTGVVGEKGSVLDRERQRFRARKASMCEETGGVSERDMSRSDSSDKAVLRFTLVRR